MGKKKAAANGKAATESLFRDRIKELRRVKASELVPHEANWRTHSEEQRAAMRGVLQEVGWVDGVVAIEQADGSLKIINGHLRQGISGDDLVPVLVTDLTEDEARKVLLTFDPVSAMADTDQALLAQLIEQAALDDNHLRLMVGELAANEGLYKLQQETGGENSPQEHWQGMPEFEQPDIDSWKCLKVHFKDAADYEAFQKLVGQKLTDKTRAIWYPEAEIGVFADKRYVDES